VQGAPTGRKVVASLRRFRLGREGRDGPMDKARLDMDRFMVVETGEEEGMAGSDHHQPTAQT
jgi:hypothetical protein